MLGLDPRRIDREDVRAIREIGDAPKTLRLALGAISAARAVKAGELGVGCRIELRLDIEHEAPRGRCDEGERGLAQPIFMSLEPAPIKRDRDERELVRVEQEGSALQLRFGFGAKAVRARTRVARGSSEKSRSTVSTR